MKLGINLIGWALDRVVKKPPLISRQQLRKIAPFAKEQEIDNYLLPINRTLTKYHIDTPMRIAHFLAQIIHESGSFNYKEEIASGKAYEGRKDLGNIYAGDGVLFKGRGLIQITGRNNYTEYAKYIDKPVMEVVTMATNPEMSADIAGWYWDSRNINAIADKDDVYAVTKKINGGYNGITDRIENLERAKNILI